MQKTYLAHDHGLFSGPRIIVRFVSFYFADN